MTTNCVYYSGLHSFVGSDGLDALNDDFLNHLVLAVDMSSGNNLQLAVLSVALLRDELIAVLLEQLLHFSAISGVFSKKIKYKLI